jgi:hypothetical protein
MATRKKHTPEQVVRKLATADRKPRRDKYTTWTAVAPDLVLTVLTYGPSLLYGPPLVRNFSSPDRQTSRSPRRAIGYARILSQVSRGMPVSPRHISAGSVRALHAPACLAPLDP